MSHRRPDIPTIARGSQPALHAHGIRAAQHQHIPLRPALTTSLDWRPVRWTALGAYTVVLISWSSTYGVPIGHDYVFGWIFIGLACASIGKSWRAIAHMLIDWGPLLLVVIAYDLSRGWADDLGLRVHFTPQLDADKLMFVGHVPTEWLQSHLYHTVFVRGFNHSTVVVRPQPTVPMQWWEVVFDLTYLSHYLTSF